MFFRKQQKMETNKDTRLQELGGSDYETADGQPSIKGWDVKDTQGKRLGEVDELIFDTQSLKVLYIVLDLEGNAYDVTPQDVLIPIGLAELHENNDEVILKGVTAEQLKALPAYKEGTITSDMETSVRNAFSGAALAAGGTASLKGGKETGFYEHEHFNEENFYRGRRDKLSTDTAFQAAENTTAIPIIEENLKVGKRTIESGGIRLHSRIAERAVEQDINLKEESVQATRQPVNRMATGADFKDETIEMIQHAEVPVVTKEAHVVEEITLNKEVNERDEIIKDSVRSTEVDVEELGKNSTRAKKEEPGNDLLK